VAEARDAMTILEVFFRAFDAGLWKEATQAYAPDAEIRFPGMPLLSREGFIDICRDFRVAFPDIRHTFPHIASAGATVGTEVVATGTHSAALALPRGELAPTGRRITLRAAHFASTDGTAIGRHTVYFDQVEFMMQLGMMPNA